ncbi:MAG: hypothetical protein IJF03_12035 [Lachnospiraceae bacterium]|nr:hypothetical protein [Lachnospiraceae bacterium]
MSQFVDEEILKEKRRIQQEQAQLLESERKETESEKEESIFDGVITIEGQKVQFERVEIPELQISIMMPDFFFLLSEEVKQYIYPAGNRPSHVYGGENIYYQLSLSKTSHQVPDEGMVKFLPMAKKLMEVMGPKTKILAANVVKHPVEDTCYHVGIMEFISQAVDMSIYNVMFYISINNQLLMGNITFPYKKRNSYMKIAKETIDSIIVLQGGEE